MAEDHWRARRRHDVQAAAPAGVRAVHQHACGVDGLHHLVPKRGEALLNIMAATSDAVVAVIGQVHLAHAQALVQRHHVGLLQQGHSTFQVKADGELPLGSGAFHVLNGVGQHKALRLSRHADTEASNGLHHLRQRVHVHADVDRHIMHAGSVKALDRCKTGLRVQRQAGMGFPVDHDNAPVRRKPAEASIRF